MPATPEELAELKITLLASKCMCEFHSPSVDFHPPEIECDYHNKWRMRCEELERDRARLDLIEKTKTYPWPDFGGLWKFRDENGKLHVDKTLRGVLDLALAAQPK